MNTKTIKGIAFYIAIILGILIVIGVVVLVLMYFFPNLKIAGYGFILRSNVASEEDSVTLVNTTTPISLTINTGDFDIKLSAYEDTENTRVITYQYYDCTIGMTNSEITSVNQVFGGTSLTLTLNEPTGLLTYGESYFDIKVPNNYNYKLNLKSNGGDINVSELSVLALNVTSNSGSFKISKSETNALLLSSLILNTTYGKYYLNNYDTITVSSTVQITSNRGDFYIKTLSCHSMIVRGNDVALYADVINTTLGSEDTGFDFASSNGKLEIGTLNSGSKQNSVVVESCQIEIPNDIIGITRITSTYGNIILGTIYSNAVIESTNGNISVTKAISKIIITSQYGDITIDEYQKVGQFFNQKGKITAYNKFSSYNTNYETIISNKDGEVYLENNYNRVTISISGRSSVTVKLWYLRNGSEDYKINNTMGTSNIWINLYGIDGLCVKAKGIVSGTISSMSPHSSDLYQIFPDTSSETKPSNKPCIIVDGGSIVFHTLDNPA